MEEKMVVDQLREALTFIRQQREQIARLKSRLERLEKTVEFCFSNPDGIWLYRNREERCDPSQPIFDPERGAFHEARYLFASRYVSGQRVLDIACGTGYGTRLLVEQGQAQAVLGIDLSAEAVGYAQRKHAPNRAQFAQGSATAIPLPDESVDIVVSFETIEHVPDDKRVIAEFSRVLVPQGRLIISTPNNWPLEIAPFHTQVYNRQQFEELLQTHFSIQQMFNQNSGSDFPFNHGQPKGIVPTTSENEELAECFLVLAEKQS